MVAFLGGKPLASAGDADPGKEGFWWLGRARQGQIQHAFAPAGGRADCLRFASPAEATWRLGDFEDLIEMHEFLFDFKVRKYQEFK